MKYVLSLVLIACFASCQKEVHNPCGTVTGKRVQFSIHGTYLQVDGVMIKVDLPTYTKYEIGDTYCP